MGTFSGYLNMAMSMMENMRLNSENRKDEILQQWRDSMKLPRKKKKEIRKSIIVDWRIACWNPFEF